MRFLIIMMVLCCCSWVFAQSKTGKVYRIDRYNSIYLPLGKISFADSIVSFTLGDPAPIEKYRDPTQCLQEPDYTRYSEPHFLSLGCSGTITVAFTDNGFMNLEGNDLYIFEVGPSREPAAVEISQDGIEWVYAGKISGGKSNIELSDWGISDDLIYYFVRITDLEDLCRSKSAGADLDAIAAINSVIKLTVNADVLFDVDDYRLKPSADYTLDSLSRVIQKVDAATLLIEGHTDSDGSDSYNMKLSENRCRSVRERLQTLFEKNASYEYEVMAFGESKPRISNDNPANKQINRRVEITVLPPRSYFEAQRKKD